MSTKGRKKCMVIPETGYNVTVKMSELKLKVLVGRYVKNRICEKKSRLLKHLYSAAQLMKNCI